MFYRIQEVVQMVGLSKPTIYRMAREGQFPRPVKIGVRASGWRKSEVERWAEERRSA